MLPRCVTLLQDAHVRRIVEGYTRARQLLMRRHMQEPYQGREVSAVVHSVVIHARCQRCELRGGAWRQRCVARVWGHAVGLGPGTPCTAVLRQSQGWCE